LFDAFKSGTKDVEIFHYLGMSNGIPASIASVYISSDVAGIYNVGTIPDFRKKGFGAALSRVAIAEALKHNVRKLLLQTELDSEPERLYSKIGFDQAFSGEIWSLE
jgi:GNAT superfamily N-acetyltransferase